MDPVAPAATPPPPHSPAAVAVIPARYASTRLPGKPLLDIGGRPMIEHVYRRAERARSVGRVLVATDDARVADAVAAFGGDACLTRSDHACGSDRLAEVAAALACDIIINVQGDEPLVEPRLIDAALTPLTTDPTLGIVTARCAITEPEAFESPHVVKVVVDHRGDALYFSRAPIPGRAAAGPVDATLGHKHIGLYAYRRTTLLALAALPPTPLERHERLEQLRALESGYRIATVETDTDPIGVDTADDLDRVRRLVSAGVG